MDYYKPKKYKTDKGYTGHLKYSPNVNYILDVVSDTKVRLRFKYYSVSISKLITDYRHTDGMLFESEEPLDNILQRYYDGMEEEDFITLIARPLKQMENTLREFNRIGNTGEGKEWNLDDLRSNVDSLNTADFGLSTDFSNVDTSKIIF